MSTTHRSTRIQFTPERSVELRNGETLTFHSGPVFQDGEVLADGGEILIDGKPAGVRYIATAVEDAG